MKTIKRYLEIFLNILGTQSTDTKKDICDIINPAVHSTK